MRSSYCRLYLTHCGIHHFVRHRTGKEDHEIRTADLAAQIPGRFGEHLGIAVVCPAQVFVLTLHSFITA